MGKKLKSKSRNKSKRAATSKLSTDSVSSDNSAAAFRPNENSLSTSTASVSSWATVQSTTQVSPLSSPQISLNVKKSGKESVDGDPIAFAQSSSTGAEKYDPFETVSHFLSENQTASSGDLLDDFELEEFAKNLIAESSVIPERFKEVLSHQLFSNELFHEETLENKDKGGASNISEDPVSEQGSESDQILKFYFFIDEIENSRQINFIMSLFDNTFKIAKAAPQSDDGQAAKNADKQSEKDEYSFKYLSEQFENLVENFINLNLSPDSDDGKINTNIFLNGLPLIEDMKPYKHLWEELITPFSFHEDFWSYAVSVWDDPNHLKEFNESTDKVQNDKSPEKSSSVSQCKDNESSDFKFDSSENRLSSSDSSSGKSNVTVLEAAKRLPIPKAKVNLKQESPLKRSTDTSKSNFAIKKYQSSAVSVENKIAGTPNILETTAERSLPGLSDDSLEFSSNTACGEYAERSSCNSPDGSDDSFITVYDADDDDTLKHECKAEFKNSKSRGGSASADSSSTSRTNYGTNQDSRQTEQDTELDEAIKLARCFKWMYELNIQIQRAFKYLSKKSDKILKLIFTSPPDAYQEELLNYVKKMTILRNLIGQLKTMHQKSCKSFDIPENENVHKKYDIDIQVCLLKEKGMLMAHFWSLLQKYNEELFVLLNTIRKLPLKTFDVKT